MTGDAAADTQRIHSFLERIIRQDPASGSGFIAAGKPVRQAKLLFINYRPTRAAPPAADPTPIRLPQPPQLLPVR